MATRALAGLGHAPSAASAMGSAQTARARVALLGVAATALSLMLQNFRIAADGTRVDDAAKAPAAPSAVPTAAPSASAP